MFITAGEMARQAADQIGPVLVSVCHLSTRTVDLMFTLDLLPLTSASSVRWPIVHSFNLNTNKFVVIARTQTHADGRIVRTHLNQ